MNRERAKELAPILEHFGNGGDVERRFATEQGPWTLLNKNAEWFDAFDYKIAEPKPPEKIWVNCNDSRGRMFGSKKQAEQSIYPWTHVAVRYRRDDDE